MPVARFSFPPLEYGRTISHWFALFSTANAVRKITPADNVSTFADLPLGFQSYTGGIAADATGNVYLSRGNRPTFSKPPNVIICPGSVVNLTPQREVSTVQANGVNASFNAPQGIFVDATSNIYLAEGSAAAIHKISPNGLMTSAANPLTAPDGIALRQESAIGLTRHTGIRRNLPGALNIACRTRFT